jgi:hypothetical protein
VFAAFTAIFAKLGLAGIDADFATLVRTWVILVTLTEFVLLAGKWRNPLTLPSNSPMMKLLSGLDPRKITQPVQGSQHVLRLYVLSLSHLPPARTARP